MSQNIDLKTFLQDYGVGMSALATMFAALVALFKDWIYSFFSKPKLIKFNTEDKFTPYADDSNSEADNNVIDSYIYEFKLKNVGKSICKNIQMFLEEIQYKGANDTDLYKLDIPNTELIQCNSKLQSINLPQFGRPATFELIKILNPDLTNNGINETEQSKARIKVGNYMLPEDETGGEYQITFCVYSENSKTKNIIIVLDWKGVWNSNKEEFLEHCVKIEVAVR